MFANDTHSSASHFDTVRSAIRRRAVYGVLYGVAASVVATACLGFLLVEAVKLRSVPVSLVTLTALATGLLLGRFGITTLRATRFEDIGAPESSPVLAALQGDARDVAQLGAVRGRASFVVMVLANGERHDLPLAEEEVEPLYRFLQLHVRHATPADLGFRR